MGANAPYSLIHNYPFTMKHLLLSLLCGLGAMLLLHSCMGDEPLNMECDLLSITIDTEGQDVFYNTEDASMSIDGKTLTYTQDTLTFITRIDATIGAFPVSINYTDGATPYLYEGESMKPFANGSRVDFSQGDRHFRIVSEDAAWHRDYFVRVVHRNITGGDMLFDFNTYELDPQNSKKFYIWPATDENAKNGLFQQSLYWCNGNPGYKLSKSTAPADDYPSTPAVGEGPDGSDCVKMETKDTGAFGKMVGLLMAPGSMFNGSFDVANALKNALKATLFGSPFNHKPTRLSFDAKYVPGTKYQDNKGKEVAGLIDEPDAYVVLFRNTDAAGNKVVIDGNDVLTNPNIVAMGRLPHNYSDGLNAHGSHDLPSGTPIHGLTAEWQHVTLDIHYTADIDPQVLANMGYSLYIGFSSSWQGGYFEGSIGSKFWIDNVRLECEE